MGSVFPLKPAYDKDKNVSANEGVDLSDETVPKVEDLSHKNTPLLVAQSSQDRLGSMHESAAEQSAFASKIGTSAESTPDPIEVDGVKVEPMEVQAIFKQLESIGALVGSQQKTAGDPEPGPEASLKLYEKIEQLQTKLLAQGDVLRDVQDSLAADSAFRLKSSHSRLHLVPWLLLIPSLILVAWLAYQWAYQWNTLSKPSSRVQAINTNTLLQIPSQTAKTEEAEPTELISTPALELIQWGLNKYNQTEYGDYHLGDELASTLSYMMERLVDIGFVGTIKVSLHDGNYCLAPLENGQLGLSVDATSVLQCAFSAESGASDGQKISSSAQGESIVFSNFMSEYKDLYGDRINIEIEMLAAAEPKFRYPAKYAELTSKTWNAVAALNNRVEIELLTLAAQYVKKS